MVTGLHRAVQEMTVSGVARAISGITHRSGLSGISM